MSPSRKRAVVYLRQSQDRTGEGLGIDRQRADVLAVAELRGWDVIEVYIDNDVSATSRKVRPSYARMLAAVEAGRVDVVAARHLDRLLRSLRDLEDLLDRCEAHGAAIVTTADGIDTGSPGGRTTARILASVARGEIERKSERQASGIAQAVQAGRPTGGSRPFGYEADMLTIRDREAAVMRQGYADIQAGVSLAEVARRWQAATGGTGRGATWTYNSVHQVLTNPRNAGLRRHATAELVDHRRTNPTDGIAGVAAWPGIVSEGTYYSALTVLSGPHKRRGAPTEQRLLTGVAACGVCGRKLNGGTGRKDPVTGKRQRVYACLSEHYCITVKGDPIDEYVSAVALARLARPDALDLLADDDDGADVAALHAEAAALRGRLETLAVEFADGELSAAQLRAANTRLTGKLDDVDARLLDVAGPNPLAPVLTSGDVSATWSALPTAARRDVIDALMTVVVNSPGRGARTFRPETIEIEARS